MRTIAQMPDDRCWSQVDLKKYRTNAKRVTSCRAMNTANHRSAAESLARFSKERKFKVDSLIQENSMPNRWCKTSRRSRSTRVATENRH